MIRYQQTHQVTYIKLLCDSQAAILALDSKDVRSKTVMLTIEALNAVADVTASLRLEWVKAHVGIEGNEEADKAAKEGADTSNVNHIIDMPWTAKKNRIKLYTNNLWQNRWDNIEGHRQTKLFIHTPDEHKARGILRLSRGYLTTLIRAITGHNFLGKHQNYINQDISKAVSYTHLTLPTIYSV